MNIIKNAMSAEIDNMIDEIISKFGHEASESINFCKEVENGTDIGRLRGLYLCLMLK